MLLILIYNQSYLCGWIGDKTVILQNTIKKNYVLIFTASILSIFAKNGMHN